MNAEISHACVRGIGVATVKSVFFHIPVSHSGAGQVTTNLEKAISEFGIHPAVNYGIVGGVAHGKPVTDEPNVDNVFVLPDPRLGPRRQ
ncbi:hypothetical protein CEXT_193431 [Caerostris extrusa]|uniref:Uncharacterized protein n=1 Tax=Caerostris extrusa TaxID=172846 RepID=A0AAV4VUX4_CAEEX|nr:hypothetical protein CEXT_193431 [Caerostris extrusa]